MSSFCGMRGMLFTRKRRLRTLLCVVSGAESGSRVMAAGVQTNRLEAQRKQLGRALQLLAPTLAEPRRGIQFAHRHGVDLSTLLCCAHHGGNVGDERRNPDVVDPRS
eukprot:3310674-Rhodomonas_salina.1